MRQTLLRIVILSLMLMSATGCARLSPATNEWRCSVVNGEGRYGTLLNFVKGDAKMVRLVKEGKIKNGNIICRDDSGNISIEVSE